MTLVGIAAVGANGAIGRKGKIPWHYPEDFRFFKKVTMNAPVVMGLTTFEDVGALPGRLNVILSFEPIPTGGKDIINLTSIRQVELLADYAARPVFICGGASVYKAFIPYLDHWWITHVPDSPEDCDAFMPDGCLDGFQPELKLWLSPGLHTMLYSRPGASEKTSYPEACHASFPKAKFQ